MPGAGGSPEGETLHDQSRGSGRYSTTGPIGLMELCDQETFTLSAEKDG